MKMDKNNSNHENSELESSMVKLMNIFKFKTIGIHEMVSSNYQDAIDSFESSMKADTENPDFISMVYWIACKYEILKTESNIDIKHKTADELISMMNKCIDIINSYQKNLITQD